MSNSYLLINKFFINNEEVKFTNISVEVNIATVPSARITTKESIDVPKGAKVDITTRIISEKKLTSCKNNYFKKLYRYKSELEKISEESDSGNRIFYQGRVYAVANTSSETMSMKTIVAIGKAHHMKSIKVPVWTDVKEKKLKNMVKLAFKGWPLKMESVSTKLNSFNDTAKSKDSGESMANFIGKELYNIIYSEKDKTGIDPSVFLRMKEDFSTYGGAVKINYIPFKSMLSGARSFVNGKFKELLEKVKDDSNPDFLAFWQVLLDIFDVEIVFLPFDINGSSVLVKPRYDEIAPSAKHINVVIPREIGHANRFSNSFREATRVMLNIYTETDVSNFPVYMNYCQAEYVKSMGGFLYNITQFGTQETKKSISVDAGDSEGALKTKLDEAKKIVGEIVKEISNARTNFEKIHNQGGKAPVASVKDTVLDSNKGPVDAKSYINAETEREKEKNKYEAAYKDYRNKLLDEQARAEQDVKKIEKAINDKKK